MRSALLLVVLTTPVFAATDIAVNPPSSIQAAISAAFDGDRLLVGPGTYVEQIDFGGKAIEVIAVQGSTVTTIDAGGNGTAVRFTNGEGTASRLAGFTITGGTGTLIASGIYCSGTTPTIEDCVIRNNTGKFGGGVHGNPVLRRCTIRNNSTSQSYGGGVWGAPTMIDCLVSTNTSTGGAGGGVFLTGGNATILRTTVEGNSNFFGQGRGGGIYVDSTATGTIERCVIHGNSASAGVFAAYGGGIYAEAAGTTILNCTIVNNVLSGSNTLGGGVYGPVVVRNSIVRGNSISQVAVTAGGSLDVTYSDLEGGFAGTGNIDLDPAFVDLPASDFHLLPGSPCIDAGDPTDPLDLDASVVDMGAYAFGETLFVDACNGDGGVTPVCTSCPCGNDAAPATIGGCLNSRALSTRLLAGGSARVSSDTLRFGLTGGTSSSFAVLVSASALAPTNPASPCFGLGSGLQSVTLDGLRCAVQDVRRHGARALDVNGDVGVTTPGWGPQNVPSVGLIAQGPFSSGQTRFFQAIYRENPGLSCGTGQNTSQAVRVDVLP